MSTLVRYAGPLAAYRSAIGIAADGGAMIGGRLVVGQVEPPRYVVTRDDVDVCERATWDDAAIAFAHATGADVDRRAPDPAGMEQAIAGVVYRLTVC